VPIDYERYPDNWLEISGHIRNVRAGGKCEQCGAPNGVAIARPYGAEDKWVAAHEAVGFEQYYRTPITVVLTVHHIGIDKEDGTPGDSHDKMDCRDENLIALCQRCHLLADLDHHIEAARVTRLRKARAVRESAGQMKLFDG
jgi:hypothetical protein